jgi:hypothetical protein
MLKSAIVATISIASILFIASLADAKDRSLAQPLGTKIAQSSTHPSASQAKTLLVTKQSEATNTKKNTAVPESDLKAIRQAYIDFYHKQNLQAIPKIGHSGATSFHEIKSLKLSSYNTAKGNIESEAKLEYVRIERTYSFHTVDDSTNKSIKRKIAYDNSNYAPRIMKGSFLARKINGKWQV